MNHKIYSQYGWTMLTGLALCAACAEENDMENLTNDKLKEATVFVDYAIDDFSTRSVNHNALPANERISSLTYLLYDANGNFLKQREIPDINTNTVWPMKRSSMTWKQREALRDTLKVGQKYSAVFVANTAQALFNNEEVLHLTKMVDGSPMPLKLDEVYLSLPQTTAFNDKNMFYLDVNEVVPTTNIDRDHPYNCPVMLERIVSRTDFFSDDYPAWDTEFTKGKIRKFTDKVYGQLIPVTSSSNPLHVNDMLKRFTQEFCDFTYPNTIIPGEGMIYEAWVADFARNVNELDCMNSINALIQTAEESALKELLYQSCLKNKELKQLWQPWAGLTAKVTYTQCANQFFLASSESKANTGSDETTTPLMDMVMLEGNEPERKKQHSFTLIGFGENPKTTDGIEINRMKEVLLYNTDNATLPLDTLPLPANLQSFAEQGGNQRVQLEYCPIKELTYNTSHTTGITYQLPPVNLKALLPASLFVSELYMNRLQEFFNDEKGKKYGKDIEHFIFEITLPDLSAKEALTIKPEWRKKQ